MSEDRPNVPSAVSEENLALPPGAWTISAIDPPPQNYVFFDKNKKEMLRLDSSGDIFVGGRLATTDPEVVQMFREWVQQSHRDIRAEMYGREVWRAEIAELTAKREDALNKLHTAYTAGCEDTRKVILAWLSSKEGPEHANHVLIGIESYAYLETP